MIHRGARLIAVLPWFLGLLLPISCLPASPGRAGETITCGSAVQALHPDGSDNTEALRSALAACAGQTLHIHAGTYIFKPQGFQTGLMVPAHTAVVGDGTQGNAATVLRIDASGNFAALLWVRNVSDVTVRGIRFEGTSYESGCQRQLDYGHAIYIQSDAGQSESIEKISIEGNLFRDFNGQSWITLNASPKSEGIGMTSQIRIADNIFVSDAQLRGGCSQSGGIAYPSAVIWLHGSNLSTDGQVANVSIVSNTFNAAFVKGAVATWSGTRMIRIEHNTIHDVGRGLSLTPGVELGLYAILIYNSAYQGRQDLPGLHPDGISIIDNDILNPVSCGVYVAKGRNVKIVHNRISGQSDEFDGTLPKGAVSLNHAESLAVVDDNDLDGNYIGISSVASDLRLGNNRIHSGNRGIATKIR